MMSATFQAFWFLALEYATMFRLATDYWKAYPMGTFSGPKRDRFLLWIDAVGGFCCGHEPPVEGGVP